MRTSLAARLGTVVAGLVLLLSFGAVSALAKEGISVSLAAPISADAKPGDVVAVFFTLTAISDAGEQPLRGSPAFLRLYGSNGALTEADGVETRTPGTYKAMIEIPAGGALRAEFGIHGSSTDTSGGSRKSDIVWAYDGILVAAAAPEPVDPNADQVPLPKVAPVNPAAPAAGGAAPNGQTAADASAAGSAVDPRWAIAAGVVLLGALAAGWAVSRHRLSATAS